MESYALPWYFAANHVVTDAWEKRSQKGYIITCGDEPVLENYPASALREIMGSAFASEKTNFSIEDLYEEASKKWYIHHIDVRGRRYPQFAELLKSNYHTLSDHTQVVDKIYSIIENSIQTNTVDELKISTGGPSQISITL